MPAISARRAGRGRWRWEAPRAVVVRDGGTVTAYGIDERQSEEGDECTCGTSATFERGRLGGPSARDVAAETAAKKGDMN